MFNHALQLFYSGCDKNCCHQQRKWRSWSLEVGEIVKAKKIFF
jgi:hypothetical protein